MAVHSGLPSNSVTVKVTGGPATPGVPEPDTSKGPSTVAPTHVTVTLTAAVLSSLYSLLTVNGPLISWFTMVHSPTVKRTSAQPLSSPL